MKHLNLKWKLTFWSAFLLLILFLSYSLLQYFVIQNWVIAHEKQTIQKKMEDVLGYLQESNSKNDVLGSEHYLDILNENDQLIRIVDEKGIPLFTISDEVPGNLIIPKHVAKEELYETSPESDRLILFRKPLEVKGFKGTVEIVRNTESFDSLIQQIFTIMIGTSMAAVVLSFIGGRFISFQLLKPINMIIRTMKKIKENGLRERVPVTSQHDEIAELGVMFNGLMDNLERSFQQQQQFVEDASHELKTPLSIIHGHLSLLKRWGKDDPEVLDRSIQLSLNETNRLIFLVSDLLELSRTKETEPTEIPLEPINLKSTINDIIENFQLVNKDRQFSTSLDLDNDFTLKIVKKHFEQIIIILLDNAIKYSTNEKAIEMNVYTIIDCLTIEIKDYGIGIPKEELPFVFNRFHRVDKARSSKQGGNGLGLSIAKKLLDYYKGTIEIDSLEGKWTSVRITFQHV